jgi:hypothetical protein
MARQRMPEFVSEMNRTISARSPSETPPNTRWMASAVSGVISGAQRVGEEPAASRPPMWPLP